MTDITLFKKMTKARIKLLVNQPFFGQLALRLNLVEKPDLKPPTLATNGKSIFYHPEWVASHDDVTVQAGIGHEVGHVIMQHLGRGKGKQQRRWNHAVDYAVNDMLSDCGFQIPDDWVHNPMFKGMAAEAIYKLLPEDPPDGSGGSDGGFDGHSDEPFDEEQAVEWQVAAVNAAEVQRTRQNGTLPGTLQRFIDEMTSPKVDWRTVLRRFANSPAKDDYAWHRPNRKYLALGVILPGMYSETVEDGTTIIDTSGSITQEVLTAFSSEIADIRVSVKPRMLRTIYCDARVNHVDEFLPDDEFKTEMHGGGGTDFRPPFDWLEERAIEPTFAIYLTDGYGPFPKEEPKYPVLWVMTTDVQPPWGECVRIEL